MEIVGIEENVEFVVIIGFVDWGVDVEVGKFKIWIWLLFEVFVEWKVVVLIWYGCDIFVCDLKDVDLVFVEEVVVEELYFEW